MQGKREVMEMGSIRWADMEEGFDPAGSGFNHFLRTLHLPYNSRDESFLRVCEVQWLISVTIFLKFKILPGAVSL